MRAKRRGRRRSVRKSCVRVQNGTEEREGHETQGTKITTFDDFCFRLLLPIECAVGQDLLRAIINNAHLREMDAIEVPAALSQPWPPPRAPRRRLFY